MLAFFNPIKLRLPSKSTRHRFIAKWRVEAGEQHSVSSMILEVTNLVKQYAGMAAVDGVSFAIEKGICFGLLGPNGAGKTTTIEVIEGIRNADSGEILYNGKTRDAAFQRRYRHPVSTNGTPVLFIRSRNLENLSIPVSKEARI